MRPASRHLLAVLLSIVGALPLPAQSYGGQAVDRASGTPLPGLTVRLLQHRDVLAVPLAVDSTRTDALGMFEFRALVSGAYQAEFGPRTTPFLLGPIDTIRGGGRVVRRYVVAVPYRPPTPPVAIVADSTAGLAATRVPDAAPMQPSILRVGALTTLGAVLGSVSGLLVADLRCGRIARCSAVASYPYYPAGATLGAAIGSGTLASEAGCPWGFARGFAGSILGSLAGSLIAGSGLERKHIGASIGAPIGGTLLVTTCRFATGD